MDAESGLLQYISAVFGQEVASDTINMATYLSTHNDAAKTATNYLSWISQQEGLVISENPVTDISTITGGNTRINSSGMRVFNGTTEVAEFGSTVVLGDKDSQNASYTEIDSDSFDVYHGNINMVHFGYGNGIDGDHGTSMAPYYTLGSRNSSGDIGNNSFATGKDVTARGYLSAAFGLETLAYEEGSFAEGWNSKAYAQASHAEGWHTEAGHISSSSSLGIGVAAHAEGDRTVAYTQGDHAEGIQTQALGGASHAQNQGTIAGYSCQTAMGKYNDNKSYNALEVGWGTSSTPKNILELRNNGNLTVTGEVSGTNLTASGDITATGEVHGSNILKIARGQLTNITAPVGVWNVDNVTYNGVSFSSAPIVVATFFSSSTSVDFGNCTLSVHNVTRSSFSMKIFNDGTASRSPYINWIAVGT